MNVKTKSSQIHWRKTKERTLRMGAGGIRREAIGFIDISGEGGGRTMREVSGLCCSRTRR